MERQTSFELQVGPYRVRGSSVAQSVTLQCRQPDGSYQNLADGDPRQFAELGLAIRAVSACAQCASNPTLYSTPGTPS